MKHLWAALVFSLSCFCSTVMAAPEKHLGSGEVGEIIIQGKKKYIVFSGQKYRVAPGAKIRANDQSIRLRDLDKGLSVNFSFQAAKEDKGKPYGEALPVVNYISVIMK